MKARKLIKRLQTATVYIDKRHQKNKKVVITLSFCADGLLIQAQTSANAASPSSKEDLVSWDGLAQLPAGHLSELVDQLINAVNDVTTKNGRRIKRLRKRDSIDENEY
jgi:hypothetical protein